MPLPPNYTLHLETPAVATYLHLRHVAGMDPRSPEGAVLALPNTLFAVLIRHLGAPVGMGRITGDGGLFFQINDICVHPAHQGRGLGKAIVRTLVDHLHRTAPPLSYISLLADGEAHRLYAQFGFVPTAPASIGMAFTIPAR